MERSISNTVYISHRSSTPERSRRLRSLREPAQTGIAGPMAIARTRAMVAVGQDGTIYIMGGDDGNPLHPYSSVDAWVPPPPPPSPTATPSAAPTSTTTPTSPPTLTVTPLST